MNYLIGVDVGTSSTKTVLFDENANIIASATKEYQLYQEKNGWAEQDPEDWWNATCATCKCVVEKSGVKAEQIKGIGLSGQMHGLVMLDENNEVIRNAILWCDTRTEKECEELTEKLGEELIDITCNPALPGFTASKILWVKNNEPENFKKCKKILLPKDYVRFKLTGEFATEMSDASGMQLMDVKKREFSDVMLNAVGITKDMLPKLYEADEKTGEISKEASILCGLKEGTVMAGGAADNAAAAVGIGVVNNGKAFVTIGTSGVVYAHSDKPLQDKLGRVHTFCSAVKNEWLMMGVTQSAGLSLKWFKDNFCEPEGVEADVLGVDVYVVLDNLASEAPIGANKLLFLPYLMGERTPHLDGNARGAFIGLSAIHTKKDMLRSVMEGVTYSLRNCRDILTDCGLKIDEICVCGGGGKSPLWKQMIADVFNLNVVTSTSKESAALGVAILAGVAAGVYSDVKSACEKMVSYNKPQAPISGRADEYNKFYNIYNNLYPSLKENYKELNKL